MFDPTSGYTYDYQGFSVESLSGVSIKRHIYAFKARSKQRYIIEVEEYEPFLIYVIKFYLKNTKDSPLKYNLRTNLNEAPTVLSTILNLMAEIYYKNPYCSFGFIGSHDINENRSNTKRFRIYKRIMENLFSPVDFKHFQYKNGSAYLLLNNNYSINHPELFMSIEKYFKTAYQELL